MKQKLISSAAAATTTTVVTAAVAVEAAKRVAMKTYQDEYYNKECDHCA